jgi:hypothetical protein
MTIDYGVEYATVLGDGTMLLDLSPIRVTGPMVPVIRVCRAWLEVLGRSVETTRTRGEQDELAARLLVVGLDVDHVLAIDPIAATLGADKMLRASGSIIVGGAGKYPLNVSIGALGQALARLS